ncbi:MAG: hypothetical protein AAFO07_01530 [Bacteroidota bacterium]
MREPLPKSAFQKLFNDLKAKFDIEEKDLTPGVRSKELTITMFHSGDIEKYLRKNKKCSDYIDAHNDFSFRPFYTANRAMNDPDAPISKCKLNRDLLNTLCIYMGEEHFESYKQRFLKQYYTNTEYIYKGYYYWAADKKVYDFNATIRVSGNEYFIQLNNLHKTRKFAPFTGSAERNGITFTLDTTLSSADGINLSLSLYLPDRNLDKYAHIQGFVVTVSSFYDPIALKVILVNIDKVQQYSDYELYPKRFLSLEREVMTIKNDQNYSDIMDLEVSNVLMDEFDPIIGTFQVWRFKNDNTIQQTGLVIKRDLTGYRISRNGETTCYFEPSRASAQKLCITIKDRGKTTTPIVYAFINLVPTEGRPIVGVLKGGTFFDGVFCSIEDREEMIAKPMMLRKIKAQEEDELKYKELSLDDVVRLADKYPNYGFFINKLLRHSSSYNDDGLAFRKYFDDYK